MTASAPRFDLFFALPPELRERILQELCICPRGVFRVNSPQIPCLGRSASAAGTVEESPAAAPAAKAGRNCSLPLNLFLASAQLYQEASAIFYGQNTFLGLCMARRNDADPSLVGRESGLITSASARAARMRIRRLRLTLAKCGGFFEDEICTNVSEMILGGALRDLTVNLLSKLPRAGAPLTTPFRALYRLLADPDLEAVKLTVHFDLATYEVADERCWGWERREMERSMADWHRKYPRMPLIVKWLDSAAFKMIEVDLKELFDAYKETDEALRIRRVDTEGVRLWGRAGGHSLALDRDTHWPVT